MERGRRFVWKRRGNVLYREKVSEEGEEGEKSAAGIGGARKDRVMAKRRIRRRNVKMEHMKRRRRRRRREMAMVARI